MCATQYLYRGVNPDLFARAAGRLVPKTPGEPLRRALYFGEEVYFGDGTTFGESEANAVVMHQRDSATYPSSGVSTTPIFENALAYATHHGKYPRGFVFEIDTSLLSAAGVSAYDIDQYAVQPAIPGDREILLVAGDRGALPTEIIIEVIEVTA